MFERVKLIPKAVEPETTLANPCRSREHWKCPGSFSLDDDVTDLLTSWSLDGEGMTVERPVTPAGLMSHSFGLGDAFGFPGYAPHAPPADDDRDPGGQATLQCASDLHGA